MAYVFIAAQPEYAALAEYIERTLAKAGIAVWIKDSEISWDLPNYTEVLHSIIATARIFIFLDSGATLDPPEYLGDVILAKRNGKPIFFIKSAKEFHLLLPQIRSLMPKSSGLAPLPVIHMVSNTIKEPPPLHLRPGWLEIVLGILLLALTIVIVLSLRG